MLQGTETGELLELTDHQDSSRFTERQFLGRIKQKVREQDTQHSSLARTSAYTDVYAHIHTCTHITHMQMK